MNKAELLLVEKPNYKIMINTQRLKGVKINEDDTKLQLLVHAVLRGKDYGRIKTEHGP